MLLNGLKGLVRSDPCTAFSLLPWPYLLLLPHHVLTLPSHTGLLSTPKHWSILPPVSLCSWCSLLGRLFPQIPPRLPYCFSEKCCQLRVAIPSSSPYLQHSLSPFPASIHYSTCPQLLLQFTYLLPLCISATSAGLSVCFIHCCIHGA